MSARISMGFGKVAVGPCENAEDGAPGIVYLEIPGAPREHDADCADIFPVGSEQQDALAAIYFYSPESLQQTIDVLMELQAGRLPLSTNYQQQRDELLAALKDADNYLTAIGRHHAENVARIRNAITKAEAHS